MSTREGVTITESGIETMNEANVIDVSSVLFGFLAENAQRNRFSTVLNKKLKEKSINGMCIPMNIREDDIYFTISNMKDSKLNGAQIGAEYQKMAVELLDECSQEVTDLGFCDIITIKDKKLIGDISVGKAIASLLNDKNCKKIAVYGSGSLARSIMKHIEESHVNEIVLFNDRVESCMEMMQAEAATLKDINMDIERVSENSPIDVTSYDAYINTTPQPSILIGLKKDQLVIDLIENESLKSNANKIGAELINTNTINTKLTDISFDIWTKKEK